MGWEPLAPLIKQLHEQSSAAEGQDRDLSDRIERLERLTELKALPIVKFLNGRTEAVEPQDFKVNHLHMGSCVRTQLPLCLAWVRLHCVTAFMPSVSVSGGVAACCIDCVLPCVRP